MTVALPLASCPVVELRRYTLHPGRLPDLLAVFEEHLVEPQEEAGMTVAGTFADEDAPDTFTWLRGFAGHQSRVRALTDFYSGPVWRRHAAAANATMVDSDDVLLLRPTIPAHPPATAVPRDRARSAAPREGVLLGTLAPLDGQGDGHRDGEGDGEGRATALVPALEDVLGTRVAVWRTDPHPNDFPALPVRTERAVTWLAVLPDPASRDAALAALHGSAVGAELARLGPHDVRRLRPTPRSAHPGPVPVRGAGR